jgi:NADH-quinone oxidoreductase subunit C
MKMIERIAEELRAAFPGLRAEAPFAGRLEVTAGKDDALAILGYLKKRGYDHLALISCVDWMEEEEFELVYILSAYSRREGGDPARGQLAVTVKIRLSRRRPEFSTAIPVFENAEPYEREIHELFGVNFINHPRLTPLLLEREYAIPPFRKDFDTRQYVKEVFDRIPPIEDGINPSNK